MYPVISRDNNFDLIRLLAAFQVVLFHIHDRLSLELPSMFYMLRNFKGVSIFFTISGFLITYSFLKNKNVMKYGWNRMLRIYPALICLTFVTIITMLLTKDIDIEDFCDKGFIKWVIGQFTINQNFTPPHSWLIWHW